VLAGAQSVHVAVIPYAAAKEHFREHPLAKQRLAEVVWSRQSEAIVMEALLKLSLVCSETPDGGEGT